MLPKALLAFLLASPVILAAPTSPYDPFRSIVLQVPKPPEEPVCCLKPLTPVEPAAEENVLLSFEDWKARQLAIVQQVRAKEKEAAAAATRNGTPNNGMTGGAGGGSLNSVGRDASPEDLTSDVPVLPPPHADGLGTLTAANELAAPDEQVSPHFRVPLTDRFNYASLDCSARVHTAHRSAKSPSAILSSKRDRYMLSPCSHGQEEQYVIVELCEDIRIDTVQLANYEFFSGVFKDFTVSVAKTYTTDAEGWTVAGSYKAKNIRGVQSFHPPTTLRDFYRYIRIDFHSHYSHEYYCPVSLLRVYGLTHLEQWKWDIWEAESRTKRGSELGEGGLMHSPATVAAEAPRPAQAPTIGEVEEKTQTESLPIATDSETLSVATPSRDEPPNVVLNNSDGCQTISSGCNEVLSSSEHSGTVPTQNSYQTHTPPTLNKTISEASHSHSGEAPSVALTADSKSNKGSTAEANDTKDSLPTAHDSFSKTPSTSDMATQTTQSVSLSLITQRTVTSSSTSHAFDTSESSSKMQLPFPGNGVVNNSVIMNGSSEIDSLPMTFISTTLSASSPTIISIPPLPSPPPLPTGGESIYRTIMNRLSSLEANHTLYSRYMEEQTANVREVLRRLGEDVGRLEGLGKAQAQMYQRTIHEWERQRRRLEMEHGELMSRVNYLADEVVLEKRIGIIQLCLLLVVLVFMVLTRGSRGEAFTMHGPMINSFMREWGRRNLSLSGDWAPRFRSRSPTPNPVRPFLDKRADDQKVVFPSVPSENSLTGQPGSCKPGVNPSTPPPAARSRTPSSLRTPVNRHVNAHRPTTSASRPHVARSNSGGAGNGLIGPVPRSAKRWARSAHIHEVRTVVSPKGEKRRRGSQGGWDEREQEPNQVKRENEVSDPFTSPDLYPSYRTDGCTSNVVWPTELEVMGNSEQRSADRRSLPPLVVSRRPSEIGDDGAWVDTDADGSELDMSVGSISPESR